MEIRETKLIKLNSKNINKYKILVFRPHKNISMNKLEKNFQKIKIQDIRYKEFYEEEEIYKYMRQVKGLYKSLGDINTKFSITPIGFKADIKLDNSDDYFNFIMLCQINEEEETIIPIYSVSLPIQTIKESNRIILHFDVDKINKNN